MLTLEHNPPIQEVIDAGVVPHLLDWLERGDFPQLQYEATWILTNITSGSHQHTQVIIEKGAVPLLISRLHSSNEDVKEQTIWTLGNIGGDAAHCRDLILQNKGLSALIRAVQESSKPSLLKIGSWAISNLCRGKPSPEYSQVQEALPLLAQLTIESNDTEMLSDCLWALSHLSEGSEERVGALLGTGVLPRIIELLGNHLYAIQLPATRIIGNVVTGSEQQTQQALNFGAALGLAELLGSAKRNVRKEAVWAVSNVCAGNHEQLEAMIDTDAFSKLINIAQHDEKEIKKEAVWALSNACAGGSPAQAVRLVNFGVINGLSALLAESDAKIVSIALEGLNRVLKNRQENSSSESGNYFADLMEQCGGLSALERLQLHANTQIYAKARKLIEEYFEVEPNENSDLIQTLAGYTQFSI